MKKIIISIILIIATLLIYLIFFLQIINAHKIALGIRVANFDFQQELTLVYQNKTWLINLSDLGFRLDDQANINQAYAIGHGSNFIINSKNQILALFGFYNLPLAYQINQEIFQEQTDQLFENIERPTQNATLIFNQEIGDFSLIHSNPGIIVNRSQILTQLSNQIKNFSLETINLEIIIDQPEVENNEVVLAQEKAQQILANQPYTLTLEEDKYIINKEILIDWIIFKSIKETDSDNLVLGFNLDIEKVRKYLDQVALKVNQPATNAQLKTQENKAILFIPDQPGFEVKKDITFDNLLANLLNNPPIKTTPIIADKAWPEIRLWQTNQLGIKDLIGQGVSNFAGSPANRKHNIKIAVAKLNGYILSPGEEFFFVNLLGETESEQGYLPELVIKDKKTTLEYGGGVCQVSTTFFRAAVNSGLKITERQNHSFPVVYYTPHGFDATVYDPKPDLRFVNNTPNHLLIQTYVEGNQVFVNFYATDDGRQVNIKGPYILESNEDGSMKTVLTQEVYKSNGEELEKQIFYSNYKSPNLYPVETNEKKD